MEWGCLYLQFAVADTLLFSVALQSWWSSKKKVSCKPETDSWDKKRLITLGGREEPEEILHGHLRMLKELWNWVRKKVSIWKEGTQLWLLGLFILKGNINELNKENATQRSRVVFKDRPLDMIPAAELWPSSQSISPSWNVTNLHLSAISLPSLIEILSPSQETFASSSVLIVCSPGW